MYDRGINGLASLAHKRHLQNRAPGPEKVAFFNDISGHL